MEETEDDEDGVGYATGEAVLEVAAYAGGGVELDELEELEELDELGVAPYAGGVELVSATGGVTLDAVEDTVEDA
jgi:hypothetical protein